jgi:hypothetical protein
MQANSADSSLVFESRFESGNLYRATAVGPFEYDLQLCSTPAFTADMQPPALGPALPTRASAASEGRRVSRSEGGAEEVGDSSAAETRIDAEQQRCRQLLMREGGGLSQSEGGGEAVTRTDAEQQRCGQLLMRRAVLCRSLVTNRCEVLTITEPASVRQYLGAEVLEEIGPLKPIESRVGIIFTARVHPGESCSSWIMDVLMRFLTGFALFVLK